MIAEIQPIHAVKNAIVYKAYLMNQAEPLKFSYIGFIGASHQHYRKLSVVEKALYDFLDEMNNYKSNVLLASKKPYQVLIQKHAAWYKIQEIEPTESFINGRITTR